MQIEAEMSRTSSSHLSNILVFHKVLLPIYSATYAKISYRYFHFYYVVSRAIFSLYAYRFLLRKSFLLLLSTDEMIDLGEWNSMFFKVNIHSLNIRHGSG